MMGIFYTWRVDELLNVREKIHDPDAIASSFFIAGAVYVLFFLFCGCQVGFISFILILILIVFITMHDILTTF